MRVECVHVFLEVIVFVLRFEKRETELASSKKNQSAKINMDVITYYLT